MSFQILNVEQIAYGSRGKGSRSKNVIYQPYVLQNVATLAMLLVEHQENSAKPF